MLDAGCWMLDARCWVLGAGCWVLAAGYFSIEYPVSSIQKLVSSTQYPVPIIQQPFMDQQSKIDIGVATVLIILSVMVFILSSGYPMPKSGLPVNAFPRILAGIILVLCAALIIGAIKNKITRPRCFEGFTKGSKLILIVIGLLIGYLLILKRAGFIISSMLLMLILLLVFGERRKLILALVPICFVIALYIIFQKFAMVPLPKGILKGFF